MCKSLLQVYWSRIRPAGGFIILIAVIDKEKAGKEGDCAGKS